MIRALDTLRRNAVTGWARLGQGWRGASVIGHAPVRDLARVFNSLAVTFLAVVLLAAFVDGTLAASVRSADPDLTRVFRAFTDFAKADWMLVASGLLGLALVPVVGAAMGRRRAVVGLWVGACAFVFAAVAGSGIAVNVFKLFFGRGRPKTLADEGEFVLLPFAFDSAFASFPSGHTTTAFAFASAIALFVPRIRWGLLALAAVFGISRVVVGAHYPSDVLAGAVLGTGFSLVLADVFHRQGLVFAVRNGHLTPKAPRALVWPLRRIMKREPL